MKISTLGLSIAATAAITLGSITTPASALVATTTTGDWGWPTCTLELNNAEVNFYQSSLQTAQDTLTADFKKLVPTASADIDLLVDFVEEKGNGINALPDEELDRYNQTIERVLAAGEAAGLKNQIPDSGESVNEAENLLHLLLFITSFKSFGGYFIHAEQTPGGVTAVLPVPHFHNGTWLISSLASVDESPTVSPATAAIGKAFRTLLPLNAAMTPALQSCVDGVGGTFTPDLPGVTPRPDTDETTTPPATTPTGGSSFGSS
ncbi:hypothetical protein HMPREF0290_0658 [Corynebacterium efficiens YS-314]|uniref:Uncharacterized protein n=1 Tax=Corynebacterium efficiens (strain DSM 44549 / YS-314 / AJ 12310 / JCM 11189 / NBRC 100395) TaxID=196164 RepID=Q8FQ46_COREF|nr:hypothetical protein [Corynebacterium efficiens]EEW50767.1 hypothetical protein HMPREF0290_0658 [Corynebacterium efficiens YS-314]BAC18098.1 hypothetical protein [Corynebacterium efficiens YS-314]